MEYYLLRNNKTLGINQLIIFIKVVCLIDLGSYNRIQIPPALSIHVTIYLLLDMMASLTLDMLGGTLKIQVTDISLQ